MPATDKRRVTMTSAVAMANGTVVTNQAVDYVPLDILDAYLEDARSRWQNVDVSTEPDAGPGGDEGETRIPDALIGGSL